MTKMRLLVLLAVVALVLFPAIASAQMPPEMPCGFYGKVQVNGADAPEGTVISALIDGNAVATTTTTASSTYSIKISQPQGANYVGKTVTFMIDTDIADGTGIWEAGGNINVDLTVGEAPAEGRTCTISNVVLGNSTYFDSATNTLYIKKADVTGPQGPAGATGPKGDKGEPGKDASNVMGIVAIIIAVIALIVAVVVMMRKQAAKT
jgi:hypothetical protein